MWTYIQSTGELVDGAGEIIATGYSGHGDGRNNPAMDAVHNVGPIPCGRYAIGPPAWWKSKGPVVMALTPVGHLALGRSGFLMHGDNAAHDASEGCIIMPFAARTAVSKSGDAQLTVVDKCGSATV